MPRGALDVQPRRLSSGDEEPAPLTDTTRYDNKNSNNEGYYKPAAWKQDIVKLGTSFLRAQLTQKPRQQDNTAGSLQYITHRQHKPASMHDAGVARSTSLQANLLLLTGCRWCCVLHWPWRPLPGRASH
jgi:hypothetical protein